MRLQILFFGMLKELRGKPAEPLTLPEGSTVAKVLAHYGGEFDAATLRSLAVAVNQQYAKAEDRLADGDEVALLPPVSGGSQSNVPSPEEAQSLHEQVSGRVELTRDVLDAQTIAASLKSGADGAVVVFDGVVRDNTRGRATRYLEYEAYEEMALTQIRQLAAEALGKFAIRNVAVSHRLGRLEIGESSVVIAVASAHRAAAFDACRWLIDTLKREVPIWKKEVFVDGAVWAAGEPFPASIVAQPS